MYFLIISAGNADNIVNIRDLHRGVLLIRGRAITELTVCIDSPRSHASVRTTHIGGTSREPEKTRSSGMPAAGLLHRPGPRW